jgi:RHS repeat-associated protein
VHTSAVLNPVAVATDVHGSVIPSTGNTLARNATYTAYGTPSGTNTFEPRLGYRGELTLDNQLWLRARTYQPTIGRLTTRDPVAGQPGTTTLADSYHYADNNPLNRIDPTGRFTQRAVRGRGVGQSAAVGSSSHSTSGPAADAEAKTQYDAAIKGLAVHGVVTSAATMTYEEAEAGLSELRFPGFLPNSLGACGTIGLGFGLAVSGNGCLVFDGGSVTALTAGQVQSGGAVASVGYGPLVSNADHHSQLLGSALCAGAGFTPKVGLSAEVCFGLNEDLSEFTGIWTAWGGPGAGLEIDVHLGLAYAWQLFSLSTPCINGPNLPALDLPGRILDFDLPKLPSLGCG